MTNTSPKQERKTPQKICPSCGAVSKDFDGFGVLACELCGYCSHPSITGGICDICKEEVNYANQD